MNPDHETVNTIFTQSGSSFRERLEFVAQERKLSPLMKSFGWAGGTIDRVLNDPAYIPGPQLLQTMARVENVSLDWAVDCVGAPFRTAHFPSDTEAAEYVTALRDETSWHATIYSDSTARAVVVLSQPATVTFKRQRLRYTCIEVITGSIGKRSIAALDGLPRINKVKIDAPSLSALEGGHTAGTYLLTQAPHPPFQQAQPASELELREESKPYGMAADEYRLLDNYRALSAQDKARAVRLLDALPDPSDDETPGKKHPSLNIRGDGPLNF